MSENKDIVLMQMAMAYGQQTSKDHALFIKQITEFYEIVYSEEHTIKQKLLALQKIGLADNKIDTQPEIEIYLKLIDEEMIDQEYMLRARQWQNLNESEQRCSWYLLRIAQLISPSALDLGAVSKANVQDVFKGEVSAL